MSSTSGTQFSRLSRSFSDESHGDKLSRKAKESPFMIMGLGGLVAACGYGAYSYKHRGAMSTSVFLMQLRVTAQGAVVVCLTVGIGYSLLRDFVFPKFISDSDKK